MPVLLGPRSCSKTGQRVRCRRRVAVHACCVEIVLISCDSVGTCIDDNRIFDMLVWFGLCYIKHSLMSVFGRISPRENLFYRFLQHRFRLPTSKARIWHHGGGCEKNTTGRIKSDQLPTDANSTSSSWYAFVVSLWCAWELCCCRMMRVALPLARRSNVDCHGPEHLDLPTCSLELSRKLWS